jgi:TonB family protein
MDNNWEGEVLVRMVVGANGLVSAVSVKTSSGYEVLDDQALDMFRKATGQVRIPALLRGREFAVEIRVTYYLKDQASG